MTNIVNTPITMYVKEHNLELYGDSVTELMEYNDYPVKIYSDEELDGCHLVKRHQNNQQLVSVGQLKKDVRRLYRSENNDEKTARCWWVFLENLNEVNNDGKPLYGGTLKTYIYEKIPTVISGVEKISEYNVYELGIVKGYFNEDKEKPFGNFTIETIPTIDLDELKNYFTEDILKKGKLTTDFLDIPLPLNEQIEIRIPEALKIPAIKLELSSLNTSLKKVELKNLILNKVSYAEEEGYYYYQGSFYQEENKEIVWRKINRLILAFYNEGNLYKDENWTIPISLEEEKIYYDNIKKTFYQKKENEVSVEELNFGDDYRIVEEKEDELNSQFYLEKKEEIAPVSSGVINCRVSESNFNNYYITIDLYLSSGFLGEESFIYSSDELKDLELDWGEIKFEERAFDITNILLNETSDDYSNIYVLYSIPEKKEEISVPIEFYSDKYNGAGLNELLLGIRKQNENGKTIYVTNSVSLTVVPSIESDAWFVPVYNMKKGYLGIPEIKIIKDEEGTTIAKQVIEFKNIKGAYYPKEVDSLYINITNYTITDEKIESLQTYIWNPNSSIFVEASEFAQLSQTEPEATKENIPEDDEIENGNGETGEEGSEGGDENLNENNGENGDSTEPESDLEPTPELESE